MKLQPRQALTNAPIEYDYGWTKTINHHAATVTDKMSTDRKVLRLIEVEDDYHFNYQIGRYGSGMNFTTSTQENLDKEIKYGYIVLN